MQRSVVRGATVYTSRLRARHDFLGLHSAPCNAKRTWLRRDPAIFRVSICRVRNEQRRSFCLPLFLSLSLLFFSPSFPFFKSVKFEISESDFTIGWFVPSVRQIAISRAENCLIILKISSSIRSDGKQVAERRERYVPYERLSSRYSDDPKNRRSRRV